MRVLAIVSSDREPDLFALFGEDQVLSVSNASGQTQRPVARLPMIAALDKPIRKFGQRAGFRSSRSVWLARGLDDRHVTTEPGE